MASVPGYIRGTVIIDISDISGFIAITAGTLTIDAIAVSGIDLSGATTINEVITAIDAAVKAAGLASYTFGLDYVSPNFYGRILRSDGDVPAIGGTLEPLFGLAIPTVVSTHLAGSPFITLPDPPGGDNWNSLQIRAVGQSYNNVFWLCQGDYFRTQAEGVSSFFAQSSGWLTNSFSAGVDMEIQVGVLNAYNVTYFDLFYDPASREIRWRTARALPAGANWSPQISTLRIIGQ